MNSLRNYDNFSSDIKNSFSKLISEFNFIFFEIYPVCYELKNNFCLLRFSYDRGDVSCRIKNLSDNGLGYGIFPVFKFLYPEDKIFDRVQTWVPYEILCLYAEIIDKRLRHIIAGDFSWVEGYKIQEKELNSMIGYMWQHIDSNDVMFKKFRTGDVSWIEDLKKYLKEKGLSID